MTHKAVYVAKISPNTTAPLCINTLIPDAYSGGGQDLGSIPGGVFQISGFQSDIWPDILLQHIKFVNRKHALTPQTKYYGGFRVMIYS